MPGKRHRRQEQGEADRARHRRRRTGGDFRGAFRPNVRRKAQLGSWRRLGQYGNDLHDSWVSFACSRSQIGAWCSRRRSTFRFASSRRVRPVQHCADRVPHLSSPDVERPRRDAGMDVFIGHEAGLLPEDDDRGRRCTGGGGMAGTAAQTEWQTRRACALLMALRSFSGATELPAQQDVAAAQPKAGRH